MKSSFVRPAMVLALVLGLSACGGKASFPVNGTVVGLTYAGLVINTNGMDLSIAPNATSFSFPSALSYGDVYNVTVKNQPQHQVCTVFDEAMRVSASDTAGRLAAININVVCAMNEFALGGTVSGLTSAGLVLTNGSKGGTVAVPSGATTFQFGAKVPYGASYGITVLNQPASENCSVSPNGTGVMGDADIANIAITCVTK